MHLSGRALLLAALSGWTAVAAQGQQTPAVPGEVDVDFLFNYYEQDGENSPVTGGIGTEEMDVISPVVVVRWQPGEAWSWNARLGVDSITSASTDNMDLGEAQVSSASRLDARAYTSVTASRSFGGHEVGFTLGVSTEYDYQSLSLGGDWSRSFRRQTTTLSAGLRHYEDTVELYGIDGVDRGDDDRSTTDLRLSVSQVLGRRTIGSVELYVSDQSGLLSTPFHEVILAPDGSGAERRVQERLPDQRMRTALGLRLNHAFAEGIVLRSYLRFYDDDWGIDALTLELEPRFRLPTAREHWVYPILRLHDQGASDYFGLPGTFTASADFFTADRELSEFTSEKYGLGWYAVRPPGSRWRYFETRLTSYTRDDGLDALSGSFAFGVRF